MTSPSSALADVAAASPRRHLATRFAVVALAFLALFGGRPAFADAPAPDPGTARYEVRFMQDMIDHHAMAVHMARMCVERAVHEALRATCAAMAAAQAQEIATLQAWLAQWYGVSYEPQIKLGHEQMMERMARMSAAEFEIHFMTTMIRHHWQAIVKASTCTERAAHDELVAMCEDIVVAQAAEIERMRAWLCAWYALCGYGPKSRTATE